MILQALCLWLALFAPSKEATERNLEETLLRTVADFDIEARRATSRSPAGVVIAA